MKFLEKIFRSSIFDGDDMRCVMGINGEKINAEKFNVDDQSQKLMSIKNDDSNSIHVEIFKRHPR